MSHRASKWLNQLETRTRSSSPSPTTWYAMWMSPRRAYRVSGSIWASIPPARPGGQRGPVAGLSATSNPICLQVAYLLTLGSTRP
jgi:hypothetical protein